MIKGIGVDITEIARVKEMMENHDQFIDRILTSAEKKQCETFADKRKIEYLAARFSAKESFSKAYGTGIGKEVSFQDLSIIDNELGKPIVTTNKVTSPVHISISHTDDLVFTQIIIEE